MEEDIVYRKLLDKVFTSCSKLNDCDECEFKEMCGGVWDVIYFWTSQRWEQEMKVVRQFRAGKNIKEIARSMGTSERTIQRMIKKHSANGSGEAVVVNNDSI